MTATYSFSPLRCKKLSIISKTSLITVIYYILRKHPILQENKEEKQFETAQQNEVQENSHIVSNLHKLHSLAELV